jgi:glycerate dehydrogenase
MKIVVLDGYALNPGDLDWNGIGALGELIVYDRTQNTTEAILAAIEDAAIVFTNKTILSAEVLRNAPALKYIGVLATGYNIVDFNHAREQGIVVTNVPDYGTAAVAQFAMGMLLQLCHRIGEHSLAVHSGEWTLCPDFCFWNFPLIELTGKTIGIIGYGKIGKKMAQIAKSFGLQILVHTRTENSEQDVGKFVSFETLLRTSDIITLHCPLTEETNGFINKKTIQKMKTGVLFVNTARGALVVEEDLKESLLNGKIAGAALDVVSTEPMQKDNPLRGLVNCIITPHIAWATKEARMRLMTTATENLKAYLNGKPVNVVVS